MVSPTSSLSQFPENVDCQIVDNGDSVVTYQLTATLENESSTDASQYGI